jgi:hypothetical protein
MNFRLELPSGIRWSPLLIATAIAGVAGAFVVVDHGFSLLVDLFRSSSTVESVDVTTPLLAQHEETHGLYERRFEGRSLFFAPPDWKRKVPPPPPPPPPQPAPPPPPPPAEYMGPKPIGMLGSSVYFEGNKVMEVGKESDGVTVLEVVSPWELKIKHKGKVYDVAIGQKPSDSLFKPLTTASTPSGITVAPPPAAAGGTPSSSGTSPSSAAGTVPGTASNPPVLNASPAVPATVPNAVSQAEVAKMGMDAARGALAAVSAAQGRPDLDPAVRQRLETEEQWLTERLETLGR